MPSDERTLATRRGIALATVVLMGLTLRPLIVAVSPLLVDIQATTGITATGAGWLTSTPLLTFAAISPIVPLVLSSMGGIERCLLFAVVVAGLGATMRLGDDLWMLFAGTICVAAGIAVANVLLPVVIQRDFRSSTGSVVGVYSVTIGLGGVLAAGLAVPIRDTFAGSWRAALASWGILLIPTLVCVIAFARLAAAQQGVGRMEAWPWRSRSAWWVTAFMALQSLNYFGISTWLPSILVDSGISERRSGWLLALANLAGLVPSLLVPMAAGRTPRNSMLPLGAVSACGFGLCGLLLVPASFPYVWVIVLGIGQGMAMSLSLLWIAMYDGRDGNSTGLSSMAQSIGYLAAALSPVAVGAFHDYLGGWSVAIWFLLSTLVVTGYVGIMTAKCVSQGKGGFTPRPG